MLEVALYLYVQQGSGVICIQGNSKGPRPKDPYATLLLTDDVDASHPSRMDLRDGTTLDTHYVRAMYSLQFYRKDAVATARRFARWVRSEVGLSQARTAFPDGCIDKLRLLNGGSGYTSPPTVSFQTVHSAGADSGSGAAAVATVTRGRVTGLILTSCGEDYVEAPVVSLTGGGGTGAMASATGVGSARGGRPSRYGGWIASFQTLSKSVRR